MKNFLVTTLLVLSSLPGFGQLTLEECHEKAMSNYPLAVRYGLVAQSRDFNIQNASKGYLPQVSFSAKATYQTDVIKIPISIPGVNIPVLNKDQYQAVAEVSQFIWDGGATKAQKEAINAQYDVDISQNEVDIYSVKGRVNDLYFGILLLDKQLALNDIYTDDLRNAADKVSSFIANGVANEADLDAVRVEQLGAKQKRVELESMRGAYLEMLSAFIGEKIDNSSKLTTPQAADFINAAGNYRPELELFEALEQQAEAQRKIISARNTPKFDAFVQGGVGNPGLNIFKEGFYPYAIGGVRMAWNFGGLYTRKNDLAKITLNKNEVAVQRETFMFNNSLQASLVKSEIEKYRKISAEDDRIIEMRGNIRRSAEAKNENGTMSTLDLMREVNAEQAARMTKATHETEGLKAIYELKNLMNN